MHSYLAKIRFLAKPQWHETVRTSLQSSWSFSQFIFHCLCFSGWAVVDRSLICISYITVQQCYQLHSTVLKGGSREHVLWSITLFDPEGIKADINLPKATPIPSFAKFKSVFEISILGINFECLSNLSQAVLFSLKCIAGWGRRRVKTDYQLVQH